MAARITERISRSVPARASRWIGIAAIVGLAACGSGSGNPAPVPLRVLPVDQLFLLESSGPAPHDTTLTLTAGQPRHVVLLYPPPDNTQFAELYFPADAFAAPAGAPVQVTAAAVPGLFGLTVGIDAPVRGAATVTFKYPVHFAAPTPAVRRYGSDQAYASALSVGLVRPDSTVVLLPSVHPFTDNISARMPGSGRYLVAAPR
jgi:hypothetical protein